MAKQYIPGVSGLLTEPNPADSPSNTLSEAENVIVAQRGKVQARHGFNFSEADAVDPGKGVPTNPAPAGNNYIPQIEQVNRVLGNSFTENFLDSIYYSSFAENDNFFFKFHEFKDSSDRIISGFLVKQNRNEYTPYKPSGNTYRFLVNTQSSDSNFLYYKLNKDTGKIEKVEKIEYREVTDIFHTKETMYITTEDGIAEANLDDMYRPTDGRFFTIKWPAFPELTYKIIQSDLYQNWFLSGHKCGIRFTFYREMGYTNSERDIYESQPSRIYEIFNHDQNGILDINLDFNFILNDSELFQQWNEFTAANHGRKFGIFVYRTKIETILDAKNESKSLPTEYWQCYEEIPFDSLFTSVFADTQFPDFEFKQDGCESKFTFKPYKQNSIYRDQDLNGGYKLGDRVSYGLNTVKPDPTVLYPYYSNTFYNKSIYSSKEIRNNTFPRPSYLIDSTDYEAAKLEIVEKQQYGNEILYEKTHLNAINTQGYYKTSPYFETANSTTYNKFFGFTYKNTDSLDKYVNQLTVRIGINNFYTKSELLANTPIIFTPDDYLDITIDGQYRYVFFTNESLTPAQIATRITTELSQYGVYSYYLDNRLHIARSTPLLAYIYGSASSTFFIRINVSPGDPYPNLFASKVGFNSTNNYLSLLPNFPSNSGLKVEIWEFDETPNNFTINPYLKLTKQLAYGESIFTSSSSNKDITFFENDLTNNTITTTTETYNSIKYKRDAINLLDRMGNNTTNQTRVGTSNFIKINLNQNIKLESNKSYLVVFSSKGFDLLRPSFGIYANELIDVDYTANAFAWNSGETPRFQGTMGSAYFDISFNQSNPKYWYKLKSVNGLIDSNGGPVQTGTTNVYGSTTLTQNEILQRGVLQYRRSSFESPYSYTFVNRLDTTAKASNNIVATFNSNQTITVNCRLKENAYVNFLSEPPSIILPYELNGERFSTGNLQNVSNTVLNMSNTQGIIVGMAISHLNGFPSSIPANTTVTSVSTNSITMSQAATGNVTGAQLVFRRRTASFLRFNNVVVVYIVNGDYDLAVNRRINLSIGGTYSSLSGTHVITSCGTTSFSFKLTGPNIPQTFVEGTYGLPSTYFSIWDVNVTEDPLNETTPVTTTFRLSTNSPFTTNGGIYKGQMTILADTALTEGRIFTKTINATLWSNDDGLQYSDRELYVDPNQDGATNTNQIAPKSNMVIPFKDFYLHAGIKKPLEASISVISLPRTEQTVLNPLLTNFSGYVFGEGQTPPEYANVITQNGTYTLSGKLFQTLTNIQSKLLTDNTTSATSGELYLDSSIFRQYVKVSSFKTDALTKILYLVSDESTVPLTATVSQSGVINFPLTNRLVTATLSERPYLTLKLTSINNDVEYITIQTESIYNRNGFYDHIATKRSNNFVTEYDRKGLESTEIVSKMNVFAPVTGAVNIPVNRYGFIPRMKAGEASGECASDGFVERSGVASISLTLSTGEVYFSKTEKKLIVSGLSKLNIDQFKSPGYIILNGFNQSGNSYEVIGNYAIIYYTNIVPDTTITNKYAFNNAKVVYLTLYNLTVPATDANIDLFTYRSMHLWAYQSTSENNIPLYFYNSNALSSASFTDAATTESWGTSSSQPILTFKPHRNRTTTPAAVLSTTGDHLFLGSNQTPTVAFLEEYATLIIDRFNVELQSRNIKAYLRKGPNFAEIIVSYPDGNSIELLNGKYDETTNSVTYPGFHTFFPDIGKSNAEPAFTMLAKRVDSELYFKNELYISRRNKPEITTIQSSFMLGRADREIIGYAENTDDLYIFKEDGIFRVVDSGNVTSDIPFVEYPTLSTTIVCQAAGSIQEINDEIIFLSQYGFMSIANGRIEKISETIERDILKAIEISVKDKIRSFVNESKNLYYCSFVTESSEGKSGTYVFNTATRQWSYMNEEIIAGMEDYDGRNLVAYRQRSIQADNEILPAYTGTSYYDPANGNSKVIYNYAIDNFSFNYPLTTVDKYNNFYCISREKHTERLSHNEKDQYDFITDNYVNSTWTGYTQDQVFFKTSTGFGIRLNQTAYITDDNVSGNLGLSTYYKPRYNDLSVYVNSIYGEKIIIDSFIQFFANRNVKAKIKTGNVTALYDIKISKTQYADLSYGSVVSKPVVVYTFDFITIPEIWDIIEPIDLKEVQLIAGVPVKITFNPESGNSPDSNKLFQEYMVHTETANKGMAMNFKIDGKVSFLATDRQFVYDATATARNVFRTYVPTKVARGRYLIRRVKHDVPLENLIITGQTIVMRDSNSTRVQKDKDNS